MRKCQLDDAVAGMILAMPVKSGPDTVLVQQGVELNGRILDLLRSRGIKHVQVESADEMPGEPVDPEVMRRIGQREGRRFGDVSGNKVMQALLDGTIAVKTRQSQEWNLDLPDSVEITGPPKPRDEIHELAKKIQGLPTLPAIYLQVDHVTRDHKASAVDVANIVSGDPVFASSLLRVANSALYAGNEEVTTVTRAVSLLGHKAIRDLCLITSVLDIMTLGGNTTRSAEHFWKHAVGVGSLAHVIGQRVADVPREELFLAGLLHDIGHLFWLKYFPNDLARVIAHAESQDMTVLAAERELLDTTHTRLGKMIAQHWNLPRSYIEVIAYHHDLTEASGRGLPCLVVNVADVMAHALELAGPELTRVPGIDPTIWKMLGLDLDDLSCVIEDALLAFEENKESFALFKDEEILT